MITSCEALFPALKLSPSFFAEIIAVIGAAPDSADSDASKMRPSVSEASRARSSFEHTTVLPPLNDGVPPFTGVHSQPSALVSSFLKISPADKLRATSTDCAGP